jgi:hypothetical protein
MPRRRRKSKDLDSVPESTPYKRAQNMRGNAAPRGRVRPGRIEQSSLAVDLIGNLGRTSVPSAPPPNLYKSATGRVFATEVIRDRIMAGKTAVWAPWTDTMGPVTAGTVYFQTGTNPDVTVNNALGPLFLSMYGAIVRELMIDGNIAMRDTTLANSGTITDSFGFWVAQYSTAFCLLRGLQGCLGMGNFNFSASLIANAVNQNIFALEGALRQLMTFSVPPKLIQYLDRMCGPKANSEDDPLIIAGINDAAGGGADLTLSGTITSIIAAAQVTLKILASGSANLAPADAQAICNTFAMAYGTPEIPVSKEIEYDECVYAMHKFSAGAYRNSTTSLTFTWPNINNPTPVVPIVIPRDYTGPALEQVMSLWRPGLYSVDPIAGESTTGANIPEITGWTSNVASATAGSAISVYNNDSTFTALTNVGAGTHVYTYSDPALELLPWVAEAGVAAANYASDTRIWDGLDRIYMTVNELVDETMYLVEEMFLNPIRGVGSRGGRSKG